uniref:Dynein light chain n=1 Tax=Kalanchoe fedtschenkoi TaxID=63787 RepID=A0A7N0VCQ8_KALFE
MESPAMVPKQKKMKKSFLMSLYRYSGRADNVSQKPVPEVAPMNVVGKVNIMTRQLSCRDTNVNESGSKEDNESSKRQSPAQVGAVERGRRSVSQIETNLKSVISFLQVKVMVTDMPGFMQVHAFKVARTSYDSLDRLSSKHIAYDIKKVSHFCFCYS